MAQQMAMSNPAAGANPFQPGTDPDKLYRGEAENLQVTEYFSLLDGIEERMLHNWRSN
jgi:ER membrane protein complex subunit 3